MGNLGGRTKGVTCSRLSVRNSLEPATAKLPSMLSGPDFDKAALAFTAKGQFIIDDEPLTAKA